MAQRETNKRKNDIFHVFKVEITFYAPGGAGALAVRLAGELPLLPVGRVAGGAVRRNQVLGALALQYVGEKITRWKTKIVANELINTFIVHNECCKNFPCLASMFN